MIVKQYSHCCWLWREGKTPSHVAQYRMAIFQDYKKTSRCTADTETRKAAVEKIRPSRNSSFVHLTSEMPADCSMSQRSSSVVSLCNLDTNAVKRRGTPLTFASPEVDDILLPVTLTVVVGDAEWAAAGGCSAVFVIDRFGLTTTKSLSLIDLAK